MGPLERREGFGFPASGKTAMIRVFLEKALEKKECP